MKKMRMFAAHTQVSPRKAIPKPPSQQRAGCGWRTENVEGAPLHQAEHPQAEGKVAAQQIGETDQGSDTPMNSATPRR